MRVNFLRYSRQSLNIDIDLKLPVAQDKKKINQIIQKLFHSILWWSQACIREWIVLKILVGGLNRYDVMFP
jgi:hypothetical protein